MLELKPEITYGDLLAAALAIAALLIGLLGFIYSQIVKSAGDRGDLIAALRRGYVRSLYQGAVNWLMRGLQKLYGDADSLQAFNVSFMLSYLYPLLFFVLTYSYFDGTNLFSGKELLPADSPYRPYVFPSLLLFVIAMFVVGYLYSTILVAAIVAAVFVFVSAVTVVAAVITFAFLSVSSAFAFFVVAAGYLGRQGDYNTSLMFAFFYLVLPLVNALLDWLSWWVSRWFLARTAREPRARMIVLDVVLDFGAAVLFMLALCLLLPAGAMLLDSLYANWVDVKSGVPAQTGWQQYAVWARDDPWGKGIMVTLMLVTTLIPTLLHILLGLMAFFIHAFKGAALADFLEQPPKNWRDAVASVWLLGYFLAAAVALWGLWWGLQQLVQLPIAQWLYRFAGYFYDLP